VIDEHMAAIEQAISEHHYVLPKTDEIVFVKTTQKEEPGSAAYTHGTQIYFGEKMMEDLASDDEDVATFGRCILWHEIFHCLTRCNSDFRAEM